MKVGKKYHSLYVDYDTLEHDWEIHIVRTIRGGWVYLILKCDLSWGKRSTKKGDIGWFDNIYPACRDKFPLNSKPFSKFTTKKQAWHQEYKYFKQYTKDDDWPYDAEQTKKIEKKLQRIKPK